MECPNCHQTTEAGAAFCGNCGQPLQSGGPSQAQPAVPQTPQPPQPPPPVPQPPSPTPGSPTAPPPAPPPISPISQVINNPLPTSPPQQFGAPVVVASPGAAAGVPGYALATPAQHAGETKALLSLLFGIGGLIGALFMALLGLVLGITGIVMGTMSRSGAKRGLSTAGLILSSLSVLAGLAVWIYAVKHDPRLNQAASTNHHITAPATAASGVSTPCYSANLVNKFNVSNNSGSCDMQAFNGTTLNDSTDAYKIYADTSPTLSSGNYASIFKSALDKDVQENLPGFTTDSETATKFAGSPAYVIKASDKVHNVAVVEAAVWHQVTAGDNFFVMAHVVNGQSADLDTLEAQWQWK